jgi:hypothetical protein
MSDKESLQFDRAEYSEPKASIVSCASCGSAITDAYWEAGGRVACERCRTELMLSQSEGSGIGRFIKATLLGIAGGALGAGIWYAVRALLHLEIGLIAIVVGFLVGGGVRMGSKGRGGLLYQCLAVFLTYTAIASTTLPEIVAALRQGLEQSRAAQPAPETPGLLSYLVLAAVALAFAYAAPFLEGSSNIIGILIIGIALWEAWKINKRADLDWSGPYRVSERAPGPAPSG